MPSLIPKFHDAAERPPMGGWHYYYDLNNRETLFRLFSPEAAIDEIVRYRSNNRTLTSAEDVERELWAYWCSLHPERCGQPVTPESAGPLLPLDQRPEFFGPIIWKFLNLAASRFDETGKPFFLQLTGAIFSLMGCPDCRQEYASIVAVDSPDKVNTKKEAALWVNRVHNIVNAKRGKTQYTYAQMIREYGAPV